MHRQPLLIEDAFDFGPQPPRPREPLPARLYRFFFGDDIFISYARADATSYAPGLAARLAARKHICFFDQLAADPNEDLPERLKQKILRSTVFVLVGTEGAVASSYVRREVELFRRTGRPFIPIDVDGALIGQAGWRDVTGVAKIRERGERVRAGDPSPEVVSLIKDSFRYTRRSQWLRFSLLAGVTFILITAFVSFLLVSGAAAKADHIARRAGLEVEAAQTKVAEADASRRRASAEADEFKRAASDAQTLADGAKQEARLAAAQREAAERGRRRAQELERRSAERAADTSRREIGSRSALLSREPGMEAGVLALAVRAAEQGVASRGGLPDEVMDGITAAAMASDYSLPLEDAGNWFSLLPQISPDGNRIVGSLADPSSESTRLVLWDGRTGRITSDEVVAGTITLPSFSRDGRRLAASVMVGKRMRLAVWDATGPRLRRLETTCGGGPNIYKVALDGDGSHVIMGVPSWAGTTPGTGRWVITVCEIATGRSEVLAGLQTTLDVAFTPGDEPAVFGRAGDPAAGLSPAVVYFPRSGRTVMLKPFGDPARVWIVGFGDDGSVITLDRDSEAQGQDRVYVQGTGGDVRRFAGYRGIIISAAYAAGQARVLTLNGRGMRVGDARRLPNFAAFRAHLRRLDAVAFSPDDRTALTVGDDGKGRLWDVQSGRLRHTLPVTDEILYEGQLPSFRPKHAAFRADGERLVTGNEKGEIQTWDVGTGRPVCAEPGRGAATDPLLGVSFLVGGDYVLASYARAGVEPLLGHYINFLDAGTCRLAGTFNFEGRIFSVSFSSDGAAIITGTPTHELMWDRQELKSWSLRGVDLRGGGPIRLPSNSLGVPPGSLHGISPDGTRMLLATPDNTLQLWRPGRARPVRLERGQIEAPGHIRHAFSADGTRVAVLSSRAARVWDARSGKLLLAFKGESGAGWGQLVSLSADGSKLLVADKDHTARIYPTSREDFLRVAQRLLGR